MGVYQEPEDYGIPNPWGPRTHNWKGGPLNEGSLFHGPIYTRPDFRFPWVQRPSLQGLGNSLAPVVHTRNGLFSNMGYGGGVFNLNTAFGSVDTPSAIGQAIEDHERPDFDASPEDDFVMVDDPEYPWQSYSMVTHQLQAQLNVKLKERGACVLLEDGFMGPRTCGALRFFGRTNQTCNAHGQFSGPIIPCPTSKPPPSDFEIEPQPEPAPPPPPAPKPAPPPPPVEPEPAPPPKKDSSTVFLIAAGLLGVAAVTVALGQKKG